MSPDPAPIVCPSCGNADPRLVTALLVKNDRGQSRWRCQVCALEWEAD